MIPRKAAVFLHIFKPCLKSCRGSSTDLLAPSSPTRPPSWGEKKSKQEPILTDATSKNNQFPEMPNVLWIRGNAEIQKAQSKAHSSHWVYYEEKRHEEDEKEPKRFLSMQGNLQLLSAFFLPEPTVGGSLLSKCRSYMRTPLTSSISIFICKMDV